MASTPLTRPLAVLAPAAATALSRRMRVWRRNARTRQHLSALPPHLLRDVGLTVSDASQERAKWFWQT